jgi:hypothetical protein
MSTIMQEKQSGMALVELMLALLFSTMMIAGSAAVFNHGRIILDQISYQSAMLELSTGIEKAFSSRDTYAGLNFDVANTDLAIVPNKLSTGIGPGGSQLDIISVPQDGVADKNYEISLTFDDASEAYSWCVSLLKNNRGYWRETGPVGDVIDNHSATTLSAACDDSTELILRR